MVRSDEERVRSIEHFQRECQCPDGREGELRTEVTPLIYPF
jgi:hypothetical protein